MPFNKFDNLTPDPSPAERGATQTNTPLSAGEGLGVRLR